MMSVACAEEINKKYSYKDFTGVSFKDIPVEEFNNTIIVGSCFWQQWYEGEEVVKDIFPDGIIGVEFRKCNLDNVYIDETKNTIVDGTHKKIKPQNDWADWIVDDDGKPIELLYKDNRLEKGLSIDPKDIPKKRLTREEKDALYKILNTD